MITNKYLLSVVLLLCGSGSVCALSQQEVENYLSPQPGMLYSSPDAARTVLGIFNKYRKPLEQHNLNNDRWKLDCLQSIVPRVNRLLAYPRVDSLSNVHKLQYAIKVLREHLEELINNVLGGEPVFMQNAPEVPRIMRTVEKPNVRPQNTMILEKQEDLNNMMDEETEETYEQAGGKKTKTE